MTERLNRSKRAACTVSAKLEPLERWPRRTAAGRRAVTGRARKWGSWGREWGDGAGWMAGDSPRATAERAC